MKAYAIVSTEGHIQLDTVRYYKKYCIKSFLDGSGMTWKECRKYGWKCKPISIRIIEKMVITKFDPK